MKVVVAAAILSIVFGLPALADRDDRGENRGENRGHEMHGAPGPIAGAGLPVLAIGYGVYWLIKRRRKVN
jgi:hypothetical protein